MTFFTSSLSGQRDFYTDSLISFSCQALGSFHQKKEVGMQTGSFRP